MEPSAFEALSYHEKYKEMRKSYVAHVGTLNTFLCNSNPRDPNHVLNLTWYVNSLESLQYGFESLISLINPDDLVRLGEHMEHPKRYAQAINFFKNKVGSNLKRLHIRIRGARETTLR